MWDSKRRAYVIYNEGQEPEGMIYDEDSPHVPCFVRLFLTKTPSRALRQRSRADRRRGSSPTPQATVLAGAGFRPS